MADQEQQWEVEVGEAVIDNVPHIPGLVGNDPRTHTPDWVMDPSLVIGQWQVTGGATFVVTKGTDPRVKFAHLGPGTFTPGRIVGGVFVPSPPRRWPYWLGAALLIGGAAWLLTRRS